jgi:hypothetical protein
MNIVNSRRIDMRVGTVSNQRFQKIAQTTKKAIATALVAFSLGQPLVSTAQETQKEKPLVFKPRVELRAYENAQNLAAGAGFDARKEFGKFSFGGSSTIALDNMGKLLVDESSLWAGLKVGNRIELGVFGYSDQFVSVRFEAPAFGGTVEYALRDGTAIKAGAEKDPFKGKDNYTLQFLRLRIKDGISFGPNFLEVEGKMMAYGCTLAIPLSRGDANILLMLPTKNSENEPLVNIKINYPIGK